MNHCSLTCLNLDDLSTRHQRATIFAQWLCTEFADILQEKDGGEGGGVGIVLDVAGGRKADVAHELSSRSAISILGWPR